MLYLGFLKFLKRDKGKEPDLGLENVDDLDVPPPPPDFATGSMEDGNKLPEFPELTEMPENTKDSFPEFEEEPLPELEPKLAGPELKPSESEVFPELKPDVGIQDIGQNPMMSSKPRPLFGAQNLPEQKPAFQAPRTPEIISQRPKQPEITPYQKFESDAVRQERDVLSHKQTKGPVYIRVEKFRDILGGMSTIRNNVKIAEQSITRLNEIDENRDKVFDRWHNVMMDMQKKLIFVDKTLFKGR